MTDALVRFLRDRLDDDVRAAQAAGVRAPAWPVGGTLFLDGVEHNVVGNEEAFCHPHNVDHIARHDPARVLREIEAKRQIVDGYALTMQLRDEAATRIKAAGDTPDADDLDTWDRAQSEAAILRDPVALLARPFSDHPDYREEWRP
jgi:hypothetical protein